MFRISILFLLLAIPVAAWGGGVGPASSKTEVLTLKQTLAIALKQNRMVKNAALDVQKGEDGVVVARTRFLPVLKFELLSADNLTPEKYTFKKGALGTDSRIGPIPAKDTTIEASSGFTTLYSASASQPLSQLYRINLGLRESKVALDVARAKLARQRQSTTDSVKKAYYAILQTQSTLRATEDSIAYYRKLDQLTDRYLEEQKILKFQSLEVKSKLAKTEYEALQQRDTLQTQKEELNDLLGRDIRTRFSVNPVPDTTLPVADLESAEASALKQRPELKQVRLEVQQAEYDKKIKKSEYLPDLSLRFNYLNAPDVDFIPGSDTSVGLYLQWEFFDWGRKHRELSEKTKAIRQAKNAVLETESQVLIDVSSAYRKVKESRALIPAAQLAQDTAEEKLRVILQQYSLNATLLPDVLGAQASFAEANHQYEQALLSFRTAKADLKKALGEE